MIGRKGTCKLESRAEALTTIGGEYSTFEHAEVLIKNGWSVKDC